MSMSEIVTLAARAGFLVDWQDAHGKTQRVPDDTLAALLKQIGLPCDTSDALQASLATLQAESPEQSIAPLITATIDCPIALPVGIIQAGMSYILHMEHGQAIEGVVAAGPGESRGTSAPASMTSSAADTSESPSDEPAWVHLAAVDQAGYHSLNIAGQQVTLAIAPAQCFGVADALSAAAVAAASKTAGMGPTARSKAKSPSARAVTNVASNAAENSVSDTNAAIRAPGAIPEHGTPPLATTPTSPRLWGLSAQVYGVRRQGDGGVGDFTSLGMLARDSATSGASAIAISPMHAMFSADPGKCSPYSPSSRLFVNVLHIDPEQTFGAEVMREAVQALNLQARLDALEDAALIDWPGVAAAKLALLRYCFDHHFIDTQPELKAALSAFRQAGGTPLEQHAQFEALHAHRINAWLSRDGGEVAGDQLDNVYNEVYNEGHNEGHNEGRDEASDDVGHAITQDLVGNAIGAAADDARSAYDWRHWPAALQDPNSPAITAFVGDHRAEVDFHIFLQWLADSGLAHAQQTARDAGMPIGLIADLAVGCDSAGSQTWSQPTTMLQRVSVGAPPDLFNQAGQAWGLTTFSPRALRTQGFRPFTDMVRHAFAHAGGIRVDHILGLRRLWLVPEGESAKNGAYLHYPAEDLLRLLALESWRARAVVIGEDLGTVPPGLREQLAEAGLMGMRVLWFEREPNRTGTPADQRAGKSTDDAMPIQSTDASSDERAAKQVNKRSRKAANRPANAHADMHPDERSDIAAITDLSDLGELDELTDIRGIVSLSDEVDDLFLEDDESNQRSEGKAAKAKTATTIKAAGTPGAARTSATAPSPQAASGRDRFVPPYKWSSDAIAMTTTHDLPTIVGWWEGHDIVWRDRIGQSSSDEGALRREQAERLTDRALLWRAMIDAGVVPAGSTEPMEAPVDAILRFVAMTATPLALIPMEDVLGLEDQPNLPGSTNEHPNWRRRLPMSLEQMQASGAAADAIHQRWKLIDSSRTASQLAQEKTDLAPALAASRSNTTSTRTPK